MAYSNYAEWKRARERGSRSGVTTSSSPSQQTSNKPASRNAGAHENYASWKAERERKAIQNRITNADTYTDAQEWQTGVGDLLREYQNFSSRWSEDPQTYDDYRRRMEAYSNQYDTLIGGLHQDTEATDSVSRTQLALRRAMEGVGGLRDFYAQFGSQQEYDAALQYSNDLANLDLDVAQAEVGAWQQERDNIANMSPEEITAYIEENKSWLPGYEEGVFYDFNHNILADYDSRITARQAYLNQIRNARQLSEMEQVIGENDFAANSAFTGNRSLGVGSEADRTYLYINDPEYREDYSISRNMSGGMSAFDPAEIESISMMTDDERSIFNYYYNTQGEDAAMEYLDKLTSTIRQRRAAERFNELEGRTGAELAFGVAAGLDQFGSGIRSLLNTKDDYIAPSWRQYASGMVREDLQDARISRNSNAANSAGQVAYDTIVSGSNMLPSILASAAVGALNPIAGQVTGAALMGASASGNAYQEMLNLGYSKAQARGYSALVGASEAGLSYLLSGISKLGGAIPGGVTEAILRNVDNAFARVAIQLGTNAASEFTEEYLQEVLTPWFQNLALNAQNDVKLFTPEALYSGLLGALTAGLMEGGGTVSSAVQTRNTGRDFLGSTATLDDLKLLAELMPDNAEVQDLAARVNENSNAYTVGRFYEAVESGMPAQYRADVEASRSRVYNELVAASVTSRDANTIANAAASMMLGKKLSKAQTAALNQLRETLPGVDEAISNGMDSREMAVARVRSEVNKSVRGMANIKRSTETATEASTTAEQQTNTTTQTEAENGYQGDRRGNYSTVESLADEYDVTPSAIAQIAQESTTQIDEKAFTESMRDVLAFTQETTLSREEAIAALQKNVTTLNAQQIAEAVILGWDLRNAVSAEKQRAYDMGFAGQDIGDVLDSKMLSHLTEAQRSEAFNEGAKVAKEAVTSGEKALPKTASVAYRKGSVRFDGDAKAISSKFKMTQRSAYIILERIAQLTGMDIVLFASKTDAQGNFIGEQGKFNSANPNEIRIDVNAGLNNVNDMGSLANYVMLRTFTHEFVHSLEVNAKAEYRALKEAVFAEIRRNGKENVENLILTEQEKGGKNEDGSYNLSYDDASHEVLAQSLVDVLPQSTFIETLATQHRNTFEKLYAALKRFMRTIRHRFEQMTSAIPSEAAALKRDVDGAMQYAQHIVDLFDKAALAAVDTVQNKGTEAAQTNEATDQQINENPTGKVRNDGTRYQRRENITDRSVLEQALADPKKIGNLTEGESYALQLWGERMNDVKALRAQRKEQVRIYNENSNENGNRDEAVKAKNRIKLYDERIEKAERKLREVENGAAMKTVLPRARTVAVEEYESAQRERLKQYRLIRSGENAVRPDDTPYTTDGENRVSYTARTVKGAGVTPDDFAELIDNEILYDGFTHIPLSNKEATNEATKIIQKKGWESALAEWKSAVRSGKTSAVMVAEGALFLNNAARSGNKDLWLDILNDYTNLSTNSAQAVQAFRILKKLSPSDKLYMIRRSVEQMVQDMHLQKDIEVDKKLSEEYLNAETETARDEALEKITKNIAYQIPSTLMDKWTALRYLNMLGNFRTQVRNIVGNVGMRMVSELKNSIMVGMERIAEAATNGKYKRTRSLFASKDLKKSAKADYDLVKDLLLSGGKYSADEAASSRFASMTNEKRRIFKFKILESYRKLTNKAMEGADALFAKSAYARALAGYLKARGVRDADFGKVSDTLMDEARAFAIRDAQEVTFRDTNTLSGWISKIGRRKDTPKFARLISEGTIPFRKTPTNVLIRAEEYTVGAINPLVKWVGDLASGQKDSSVTASQVLEAISKQLTGTGLFLLGMALRASGRLTGSGEGDDEDSFERMNGWQNYALVFPESGVNMTIDFLSPAAIPILMGAQLYDLNTENGIQLKDISNVLLSITDPLVQMSMLQGINDTLDNIKFAESGLLQIALNSALNYLTQGLTNSLLGQLERSFEKQRMTTYIYEDGQLSTSAQRNIGKMSAKTPFIDYNQIPYINAWGERDESPGLFANLMYNLFSPSYFNRGSNDAVSAEILRLNSAQSSINVFPQTPDRTISYEGKSGVQYDDVALTADEYVALATAQGQLQRNIVEDLISSPLYQDLTDSEKALAIRNAYEYARESARIEIFEDYPGYSAKWMEDIDENVAVGILNHVRELSYDDIGSDFLAGRITRDEAIALYVESGRKTAQEAESTILRYQYELDTGNDYDDLEEMFVDGTISSSNAERYLMEYGGMYRLDAETTIRQWECEKETGIRYSDIRDLYVSGDITARRAQNLRIEYGGASLDDAEKTVLKWQCEIDTGVRYEDIGSAYLSGEISRRNAISWQMKYGEKDEDEAELYLTAYEWRYDNPQYGDLSNDAIGRYIEYCEPMNIDASIFYEARHFCSDIQSDGTSGSVKAQYVEYIESLGLPFEQRRALWFALKNKSWKETGTPYA